MRLTELNPRWVNAGGERISDKDGNPVPARDGVGMSYDCPCGCDRRGYVAFSNPLDGGCACIDEDEPTWDRIGVTFEMLTLSPSILSDKEKGGCGWHGRVIDGAVTSC